MPFDALGRTRATLKEATRSLPRGGQARSRDAFPAREGRATAQTPDDVGRGVVAPRGRRRRVWLFVVGTGA